MKTDIGWAMEQIKNGHNVARKDWITQWIGLLSPKERVLYQIALTTDVIYIRTPGTPNTQFSPWFSLHSDLLATDWIAVE